MKNRALIEGASACGVSLGPFSPEPSPSSLNGIPAQTYSLGGGRQRHHCHLNHLPADECASQELARLPVAEVSSSRTIAPRRTETHPRRERGRSDVPPWLLPDSPRRLRPRCISGLPELIASSALHPPLRRGKGGILQRASPGAASNVRHTVRPPRARAMSHDPPSTEAG